MTNAQHHDVIIVGAGIFGAAAAIELRRRGLSVLLADSGRIPNPLAASTDISKIVRMEYGSDEQYMEMMEACLPRWREWNLEFNETLFHETGVAMLSRKAMSSGGFEFESLRLLEKRGHTPERLDADAIASRFPAWRHGSHVDGFYHRLGGFADSGRVVSALVARAGRMGVEVRSELGVHRIIVDRGRAGGVETNEGRRSAGHIVVAAGAWAPILVPELAAVTRITGHPVFHLTPADPNLFKMGALATFTADVSRTGWYGFPLHPDAQVVKIANHGVGRELHPDDERVVTRRDDEDLRTFLEYTFPALTDAPVVYRRRCLYCDTLDGHLWIDRHPTLRGLTVAAGGSGHGFKFAPILGDLIADAVEGESNPWLPKFRWRTLEADVTAEEATRYRGNGNSR